MSGAEAACGRRRFLSRLLGEAVAGPVAAVRRDLRREDRLEADRRVLEAELRAFGPDVLADVARRSGLQVDKTDCAAVAEALAAETEADDDDRR